MNRYNNTRYLCCDNKDLRKRANFIMKLLKPLRRKFDTIVVCGASGTLVGSIVAYFLNKDLLVTKKHYHKYGDTQGIVGKRFIIIDDFIGYGSTINGILKEVSLMINHSKNKPFIPKCVGIFLYKVEISNEKNSWRNIPINNILSRN